MFFKNSLIFVSIFLLTFVFSSLNAQDTARQDGYKKFFYPDGKISSEGLLKDGRPDGFWKAYYQNGSLKSEGYRKNFELDSLWRFYAETGKLTLEINYRSGKKNGIRTSYLDKEIIRENFVNDIKDGYTRYYYPDGKLKQEIPFVKGLEQGFGKEYGPDGTIITLTEYKKGFIVDRTRINRKDQEGRKQGKWYVFYETGTLKTEGTYKDDKKNGYFKEYAENGDLKSIVKYVDDQIQPEAAEIQKMEVQTEYYPDGKVKVSAMFRNGVPEGLRKEFNEDGVLEKAYLFKNGFLAGEGIVKDDGNPDGPWKEYYQEGTLKAEGSYDNGRHVGVWKYYYPSGRKEQTGSFNKQGKKDGTWRWYFESGNLLKEENFRNGLRDGLSSEYDESGKLIEEGEFFEDKEDGVWFGLTGDFYIRGSYRDGLRHGMWYYMLIDTTGGKTDSLNMYKGNFIDDNPDGKHTWYWDNGKIREEGSYVMGRKEGDWFRYNYDGSLFMVITFNNGVETRFDGVRIKPPYEMEEE